MNAKRLPARTTLSIVALIALLTLLPLMGCAGLETVPKTRTTTTPRNQTAPSPWKLIWGDDFGGPAGAPPDQSKWMADVGGNGWGSEQLQYNTDGMNAYQDGNSNLVLEARKLNPKGLLCWYGPCLYTSARITTRDHFSFTYGLLLARIKLPSGQGIWPAFWLLGNNCEQVGWPACGEIDVMENIGTKEPGTIHGSAHGPEDFSLPYTLPHGAFSDDYHTFGLQWDSDHISFIVDDVTYGTLNRAALINQQSWVYNHSFDIILDLSVGGTWPGNPDPTTVFPQKMYISYVHLYTKK